MKKNKPELPSCVTCTSRKYSVFCKLQQGALEQLSDCKGCNHYLKGHLLFFEGARPTGVFCISSGTVKIYRMTGDGKTQIIKLAGVGSLVGHEAVLAQSPYKYFAEVIEEALVCYIPKNYFQQMLKENHALNALLLHQISLDLIHADKRTTSMATKPVRERIAEALLLLHEFFHAKNNNALSEISLSREEIAAYAGTATETAVRVLSDFRQHKLIELRKRSVSILNQPKLTRIAHQYES